jgi:chitin synthase
VNDAEKPAAAGRLPSIHLEPRYFTADLFLPRPFSSSPFLQSIMASPPSPALGSGDLVDIVSSSASTVVYPTDDAILQVLQASFRVDRPYFRINTSHLVVVNPYKSLANTNDNTAKEYEERCYKDTSSPSGSSQPPLPPHLYDLAARAYLLMRRRGESHAIISGM